MEIPCIYINELFLLLLLLLLLLFIIRETVCKCSNYAFHI